MAKNKKVDQHHLVPNKEGEGWDIKRNGCKRSSVHKDTKKEAEKTLIFDFRG